MQTVLLVVHLLVAIMLIGGSGNLFSSRGVGNTLTRATAILAACFFATSVALTMLANKHSSSSITDQLGTSQQAPAAGGTTAPADGSAPATAPLPNLDPAKPAVPTN